MNSLFKSNFAELKSILEKLSSYHKWPHIRISSSVILGHIVFFRIRTCFSEWEERVLGTRPKGLFKGIAG